MTALTNTEICTKPTGALIKVVRERHGFTQVQCAVIAGCAPRTWQRYETKDRSMDLGAWWCFLIRIAEIVPSQLPPIPKRIRAGAMVYVAAV